MAGRSPDDRQDASNNAATDDRDLRTAALAVCCAIGLAVAGTALPALAAPLAGGSLGEGLFDQPGGTPNGQAGEGEALGGGLGALNPGDRTNVGGSLGGQSGGLRNQSAATHFYVESDEAAYWRTGAYAEYTGDGWEDGGTNGLGAGRTDDGRRMTQTVELEQSATALPAAWQPYDVDIDADVRAERLGLVAEDPVPAGTEYTVYSYRKDPSPSTLRAAGDGYRDEVKRYTRLPESTPERVESFTSRLTADDETNYDRARTIERWLEENHGYSLNASHDTSGDVADEFIFEMDRGYCEYFATAMTVMLRSQDVPARYVVGYSQGEPVGENRYQVRGMNAHAWVEVYFEGVGWVKFDPTPAADRQTVEQQALESQTNESGEYAHEVQTGPNETFEPTNDSIVNAGPPYDIRVNPDPAPGREVTVTVEKADTPVEGVVVAFDGERVGVTDENGEVTGTVPYEESLDVSVGPQSNETDGEFAFGEATGGGPTVPDGDAAPALAPATQEGDNETRTYEVDTNVSVEVAGTPTPGATVDLLATAGGEPMRNATVSIDGERVGETDRGGVITVTIPDDAGDEMRVAVERGSVGGEATVRLGELDVSVDGTAVAGRDATVVVTVGDEPVPNASVAVNGETVGRTDWNGELTASLPLSNEATLTASVDGRETETTLDWLLLPLAGGAAVAVAALAGVAALARRRDVTLDDVRARLRWLAAGAVAALLALSDGLDEAARLTRRALDRFDWVPERLRALAGRVAAVSVVATAVTAMRRVLQLFGVSAGGRTEGEAAANGRGGRVRVAPEGAVSDERRSLRRFWRQFVRLVSPGDWRTRTPGEVARAAVRKGFPDEPVYRLTEAFRRAEYGEDPPDEERLSTARRALDRLRDRSEER
jgi:transglutaminase-like putative cysteine protease